MTSSRLLDWTQQKDCPCYNFTKPFKYSSSQFIIANSAKFNQTSFLIFKFDAYLNDWIRFKILPSDEEDPSNLIMRLKHPITGIQLHSQFADTRFMDHYGMKNVAYDNKHKIFYAIGLDWNMWKVNLSMFSPNKESILTSTEANNESIYEQLHGINSKKSFILQPYLFIDENQAYILTSEGHNRYTMCLANGKIQGNIYIFLFFFFDSIL